MGKLIWGKLSLKPWKPTSQLVNSTDDTLNKLGRRHPRGGGGGTLIIPSYVGSGPASTLHPKNIRNFKHPNFCELLATPHSAP